MALLAIVSTHVKSSWEGLKELTHLVRSDAWANVFDWDDQTHVTIVDTCADTDRNLNFLLFIWVLYRVLNQVD